MVPCLLFAAIPKSPAAQPDQFDGLWVNDIDRIERPSDFSKPLCYRALHLYPIGLSEPCLNDRFERDRYGAVIMPLFKTQDDHRSVSLRMIEGGVARFFPTADHYQRDRTLWLAEFEARQREKGGWHDQWEVYDALKVDEIPRKGLVILRGKVVAVKKVGSNTYLNFGEDWRSDTTIRINSRYDRQRIEAAIGVKIDDLSGKNVEARGLIDFYNGPLIDWTRAGQVYVVNQRTDN